MASSRANASCSERAEACITEIGEEATSKYFVLRVRCQVWWAQRCSEWTWKVATGAGCASCIAASRRSLIVVLFGLAALLFYFADVRYGDMPMAGWVLVGALAGAGGGIGGICTAVAGQIVDPKRRRVPVSRHGLGSYDVKCCAECVKDFGLSSMGLVMSLTAAAMLGSAVLGLTGLLLSVLHHYELNHGWSTIANATEEDFSLVLTATSIGVVLYSALRHHYKSRVGWWRQGEHLLDGNPVTDIQALI
eukprot:CAMPEP_0115827474 /NCGR_PEP_ID=MMETSP0287-20121206/64_1 /TAXON_ID=412157 /ORGANISM="Chrysochromulina rotalis, Strain UIO044" /LENGTH=248 /DNA_ID=CAMNT_0003280635 /DNA_START=17 /DNA_END=763 /DNA_ORIENTATION=+